MQYTKDFTIIMKKKAHSVTKNSASFLQFLLSYTLLQANLN